MTTENLPAEAADNETPVEGAALMAAPLAETPKLDASNPIHFVVIDRLAQLEAALLARDPMMKVHLGAIHKELNQHEELVHLLSNEEIGKIVGAQQQHTNTMLAAELSGKKGKAAAANRTAKLGLDDL